MPQLLSNASATGDQVSIRSGGMYVWRVSGTFGGTTVTLQEIGPNGSSWQDIADGSLTAAGTLSFLIGSGTVVRAEVDGGSPSALYSDLTFAGAL